jgi:hypothetical protein
MGERIDEGGFQMHIGGIKVKCAPYANTLHSLTRIINSVIME